MNCCSAVGSAPGTAADVWYCCCGTFRTIGQRWTFDCKCCLTQIKHSATVVVAYMEQGHVTSLKYCDELWPFCYIHHSPYILVSILCVECNIIGYCGFCRLPVSCQLPMLVLSSLTSHFLYLCHTRFATTLPF